MSSWRYDGCRSCIGVHVLGERNLIMVGKKVKQYTQRTYWFERNGAAATSGDVAAAPWPLVVMATGFLYFDDSVVLGQNFAGEAGEIFAWVL